MEDILIQNFIDVVKESQIKLGYREEKFSMYYLVSSLNRLIDKNLSKNEMIKILKNLNSLLGVLDVIEAGEDRLCITISKEGVRYVHENVENKFLEKLIDVIRKYPATIEDIKKVFEEFSSDYVCIEQKDNDEFEYLMYFNDIDIDKYIYCIHFEMPGMADYHRFTRQEFKKFNF